jgi:hypothetical protein
MVVHQQPTEEDADQVEFSPLMVSVRSLWLSCICTLVRAQSDDSIQNRSEHCFQQCLNIVSVDLHCFPFTSRS